MTGGLQGRIALITGASRGIGAAVAERFAAEGAHVILAARSVGGLEAVDDVIRAAGGEATLVPLDLREPDHIEQLAQVVYQRWGKLDILVGNAAILGDLTPVPHIGMGMWDRVMAVNVTANLRLMQSFDPLLRASDAGRAMFVTSGITQMDEAYWAPYATSKAALEMLVRSYAAEMANTSVRINLIDPGVVATGMRAQAFPGENAKKLAQPNEITDIFVQLATSTCQQSGERFAA